MLIQFEEGFTKTENMDDENVIRVSLKDYNEDNCRADIVRKLNERKYEEVWIESNGMINTASLYLFIQEHLSMLEIKKIIYTVNDDQFKNYYGKVGNSYIEQITQADIVVSNSENENKRLIAQIKILNKNTKVLNVSDSKKLLKQMHGFSLDKNIIYLLVTICIFVFYLITMYGMNMVDTSVNTLMSVYIGMVFQAMPFLALGVIVSSLMLVFVPTDWFLKHFPKSSILAYLYAIIFGFLLPVCDCASIPIFNSLLKKKAPVGPAITFLCATPVINPLVMVSTYFAFSNNYKVVVTRVLLGIIVAVIVGMIFSKNRQIDIMENYQTNTVICNCGIFEDVVVDSTKQRFIDKVKLAISNSQNEFFNIIKYLLIGIFFSSIIQMYFPSQIIEGLPYKELLGVVILMVFSFIISLCSSSDAIVARGLVSKFSMSAAMGFMVFGPMMDIKNVILLSGIFKKKFIYKLTLYTFIVTLVVVSVVYGMGVV